jgi:hypothetical protein
LVQLPHESEEVVRKKLLLRVAVHRAKLHAELVSDRRGGTRVRMQKTLSGSWLAVVGLAHAWELPS